MEDSYPKVYKKAIKGTVGGILLNVRGQEEDFLLKGDPQTSDLTQISLEILDAESDKFFVKHNKPALVNGFLIEIADGPEQPFKYSEEEVPIKGHIENRFEILDL